MDRSGGSVKRRRVLLMISSMRGGGSERQTLLLLKHLDRVRFEPHLFVLERAGDLLDQIPSDVPIHAFSDRNGSSSSLYFPGRALREQSRYVEQIVSDQCIDVVYDRTFHSSMIAGDPCYRLGVPRVSTIVSPPEHALPLVESRFVRMKRWRLAKAYRRSKAVIAVSQLAASSAESYYGLPSDSVSVIPNPVDAAALHAEVGDAKKGDDQHKLVCVGRMTEEKGHRDLIRAFQLLESTNDLPEQLSLHLIGDGPLRHDLQNMAKDLRNVQIVFSGTVPNASRQIASASGLILPSLFEGMPNVVLEAMALKTPVIATRSGGTVELQREHPTAFWADPGAPESLAKAIDMFLKRPKVAREYTANAYDYVMRFHNISDAVRQIEALL